MKRSTLFVLGVALLAFAADVRAQGVDGTRPLVCDLAAAAQCEGEAACIEVTLEQINLPPVVRVDFEDRRLTEPAGERDSPISAVEILDAVVVLQGHQNGRGWTMVVERDSGHLSATVTDDEGAFVLAGACAAD